MTVATPIIPPSLLSFKEAIEKTLAPFVQISLEPFTEKKLTESKIGGVPYWPNNQPYPTIENEKAKLFAQINFSDLNKQGITLPFYPTEGLLQFYIAENDDTWGLEINHHNPIKVIYHQNFLVPSLINDDIISIAEDNSYMPFQHPCKLNFKIENEYLGLTDSYTSNQHYQIPDDETFDNFSQQIDNSGSKIGGYAYFTQYDPRDYSKTFTKEDEWILLLQLDSDEHIQFGDVGIANWFIKKSDLINKDFNNVFFSWDCC